MILTEVFNCVSAKLRPKSSFLNERGVSQCVEKLLFIWFLGL